MRSRPPAPVSQARRSHSSRKPSDFIPYFLGAVDEEHLLALKRYQDARMRLRRLDAEFQRSESIAQGATRCCPSAPPGGAAGGTAFRWAGAGRCRRGAPAPTRGRRSAAHAVSQIDDPQADLTALDGDAAAPCFDSYRNRVKRSAMSERLSRDATEFEGEAREQEARLTSIGLGDRRGRRRQSYVPALREPACYLDPDRGWIRNFAFQISKIQLRSVRRDAPRLQERLADLEAQRSQPSEQLRTVQADIAKRIQGQRTASLEQHQFAEQARVAGRIA